MIKIAVIDNQVMHTNHLRNLLNLYSENKGELLVVDAFEQYDKFLEHYFDGAYDILFFDISTPINERHGFETGKTIRRRNHDVNIILMTASYDKNQAVKGYSIGAMSFLKKPVSHKRLCLIMNAVSNKEISKFSKSIPVRVGKNTLYIRESEIQYIETAGKKILIHTVKEKLECYQRMSHYCSSLSDDKFFRCHNSYIVNLEFIKEINDPDIYLITNHKVPISKNRKKDLLKAVETYYGKRYLGGEEDETNNVKYFKKNE